MKQSSAYFGCGLDMINTGWQKQECLLYFVLDCVEILKIMLNNVWFSWL